MRAPAAAAAAASCKAAPPPPSGERWVTPHDGQRDERGRLKPFKSAAAHFRPNLTPHEMLHKGMHGGIYFNPKGGKPGLKYPRSRYPDGIPGVGYDEFPQEWFTGVPQELYASRRYDATRNCYKVKSGLDQAGWEASGWISRCDPRGWTQWYFRFFLGRRLEGGEDERQIARWSGVAGEKGRWKNNLIGKCLRDGKAWDDLSVSPVVRQTLLHWAYEISERDFDKGAGRVQKVGAAYLPRSQMPGGGEQAAASKRRAVEEEEEAPARESGESSRSKRAKKRAEQAP